MGEFLCVQKLSGFYSCNLLIWAEDVNYSIILGGIMLSTRV